MNENILGYESSFDEPIFAELYRRLNLLSKYQLVFEMSGINDGVRDFVISCDGNIDAIEDVNEIVRQKPDHKNWNIIAFKPKTPTLFNIEFENSKKTINR